MEHETDRQKDDPTQAELYKIFCAHMPVISRPLLRSFPKGFLLVWAAFAVLVSALIWSNLSCTYIGLDGATRQIYAKYQSEFKSAFTWNVSDPLQGMFDMYFPGNFEYFISNVILGLPGYQSAHVFGAYAVYALLVAWTVHMFARVAGFERGPSLLSGLLIVILTFPLFSWKPLSSTFFMEFVQLNPQMAQLLFLCYLVLWGLWSLDPSRPGRFIVALIVINAALVLAFLAMPPYALLMGPVLLFFGIAAVFLSKDRKHRLAVVGAGVVTLLVLLISGVLPYVYTGAKYTLFTFFADDVIQERESLYFASILYSTKAFYAGPVMVLVALAGAIHLAVTTNRDRTRSFALTFLGLFVVFQAAAYAVVVWMPEYKGPSPVYFEFFIWPIYGIFVAWALYAAVGFLLSHLIPVLTVDRAAAARHKHLPLVLVLLVSAGIGLGNLGPTGTCPHAMLWPLKPSPIIEHLKNEIGVGLDRPYRGTVATFTGYTGVEQAGWASLFYQDYQTWLITGSDHRTAGLWYYNIPTLQQFGTHLTPTFYLMIKTFLARPRDPQQRAFVAMTAPDEAMLKLWGVRYLIADYALPFGTEIIQIPVAGKAPLRSGTAPLRLVKLEGSNLGNYSPTKVSTAVDFPAAMARMRDPAFDGRKEVLTESDPSGNRPVVPAGNVQLATEKDGLHIQASSTGRSFLVLPAQYSRCWRAEGAGDYRLFRANIMQLGIAFSGSLDVHLRLVFGPNNYRCRYNDYKDMIRLNVRGALPRSPSDHI